MKNKWTVLAAYSLVAALSQYLWLEFAPILSLIEKKYNVTESTASLLVLVFPLIYVFLSIPAGIIIDKKGYRFGVGVGCAIMLAFSCLRIFDGHFYVLLIAQIGIAVAQPFVINGITKVVFDWFEGEQTAMATGLATVGMFVGMAAGMALAPAMVETFSFRQTMIVDAFGTLWFCLAFYFLVHPNPNSKSVVSVLGVQDKYEFINGLKSLLRNRNVMILFVLSFLGLGYFNGLTTWIEPILAPQGINSVQAGIIGGVLILGGIIGAGLVPAISDMIKKRKILLVICLFLTSLTLFPLCRSRGLGIVCVLAAIQGFTFLPAFSLLLEMCAEIVGEKIAGFATGILMLAGNAGGVIVALAMEWIKGPGPSFLYAIFLLEGIIILSFILSLFVPETYKFKFIK